MHRPGTIRPRLVWAGTLTILTAMVVIAVANAAGSVLWEVVGIGVLIASGLAALYGGILRDVHGSLAEVESEAEEAKAGETHQGFSAGEHVRDRRVVTQVDPRPRPSLLPSPSDVGTASVAGLLIVSIWLVLSHDLLGYPFEPQAKGDTLREFGAAVVVIPSAVFLVQHGRSRAVSALCALIGALLVLAALFADSLITVKTSDLASGAIIVLFAMGTLLRATRR